MPVLAPSDPPASTETPENAPPSNRCLLHAPPRQGRSWRLADPSYRTCGDCLDRLREQLREVAARWAALDPRPGGSGEHGTRGAPGFGSRSPAADVVVVMRDWRSARDACVWVGSDGKVHRESERPPLSVPAELYTLAVHVAHARTMTGPTHLDVATVAAWLDGQLDWVTRQDGVSAFARVVRELVVQLRPLTGEPRAKRIGLCPNTLDDEGEHTRECAAPLFAPLKSDVIRCNACGREWKREQWLNLGGLLAVS